MISPVSSGSQVRVVCAGGYSPPSIISLPPSPLFIHCSPPSLSSLTSLPTYHSPPSLSSITLLPHLSSYISLSSLTLLHHSPPSLSSFPLSLSSLPHLSSSLTPLQTVSLRTWKRPRQFCTRLQRSTLPTTRQNNRIVKYDSSTVETTTMMTLSSH